MSHKEHYTQKPGQDSWRTKNESGKTVSTGSASYNSDGSLKRLSSISPTGTKHGHTALTQKEGGSYEFYYGLHKNH